MKHLVTHAFYRVFPGFSGRIRTASEGTCNTRRGLTHSLVLARKGLPIMVPKICSIPECGRDHKGHGLCDMHIQRLRRTGTTDSPVKSQESRFWEKVNKSGPAHPTNPELGNCWEWTAALNDAGYGVLRPANQRSGPAVRAHRYSAELAGMNITDLHVLHSCDNRKCVNPSHLRPGTDAENAADMVARKRQNVGSARPESKLTESQVIDIRRMLAAGVMHKEIAAQYGVNRATITMINIGKTWRHVGKAA